MPPLWQSDEFMGGHGPRNSLVRHLPLTMRTHFHTGALLVGLCAILSGCSDLECYPPMPPLLHDLPASGGWWTNGCPRRDDRFSRHYRSDNEAISPKLTKRIRERFPLGSDAGALERYLQGEGFRISSPCGESAPKVRLAQFRQEPCLYPMDAKIAWERAEDGTLGWVKGSVFYK